MSIFGWPTNSPNTAGTQLSYHPNQNLQAMQGMHAMQGQAGNLYQQYGGLAQNIGHVTAGEDPESAGMKLTLVECALLWETHFGDRWVEWSEFMSDKDRQITYERMNARGWFEQRYSVKNNSPIYRLVPLELRR